MKGINLKNALILSCFSMLLPASMPAQNFEYRSHVNSGIANYQMPYRLYIPSNYNSDNSYPLVLFLHGAGERGTDNKAQLVANRGATLWAELETQASHPCFVVAPQCPADKQWVNTNWIYGSYRIDKVPVSNELKMVKDIIETLKTQYSIDASRLYIVGLSMGGYGTWDFILRYPTMFKAAIPLCGAGDPTKASLISTMPVWAFHSNDDPAVPVSGSREMVNAINALGLNNREQFYTEYYNHGHVLAYQVALEEPDLADWLFNAEPVTITPGLIDVTKFAGISSAQGGTASDAFDDAVYTKWLDFANDYPSTRSSWLQYHFSGNSYVVTHYSITSADDFQDRDPKNWDFLGSNNGTDWTVLDTRTDELFNNRFHKNTYSFANKTAYSYHRLRINSVYNPKGANCVQLSELRLWAGNKEPPLPSDGYVKQYGTAYRWSANVLSTSNSNMALSPGLNDGNLIDDISLDGARGGDPVPNGYEAAGLMFNSVKTISKVEFINGYYTGGNDNGCFEADFKLQISLDSVSWTDAVGWTVSPEYEYLNTSVSGATFTFFGRSTDIRGIRVTGQVRTSETSGSWEGRVKEITAYSSYINDVPNNKPESDIFIYRSQNESKLMVANIQPNTSIRVVSMNGCVVSEIPAKNGMVEFDVSHWEKGVYLFYIETANNVVVRKAIIH